MTISSPSFQRLQDGIKSVDDLRVRGPVNAALGWLSGDLVTQLNDRFASMSASLSDFGSRITAISASVSVINVALGQISQSVSVQVANQISVYASTRPTFLTHKNGSDQISISATPTPITFSTEDFDVGGYFSSSTYAPPAGKYRLTAAIRWLGTNGVANEVLRVELTKNGATHRASLVNRVGIGHTPTMIVTAVVDANGTDAFGVTAQKAGAGTGAIEGDGDQTFFCGEAIS
jgi:hypothetical protein